MAVQQGGRRWVRPLLRRGVPLLVAAVAGAGFLYGGLGPKPAEATAGAALAATIGVEAGRVGDSESAPAEPQDGGDNATSETAFGGEEEC